MFCDSWFRCYYFANKINITMSSESEMDIDCTPPELKSEANLVMENLFPAKSKEKYVKIYENFITWKNKKKANLFSEAVFLAYFNEIAKTKQPSTLWVIYSMLKCTVQIKNGINLKNYRNLTTFLKRKSAGFKTKKSKILNGENINEFLFTAPDEIYLATKVALILGINGACRCVELYNITTKDIEFHDDTAIITLRDTETKIDRMFVVQGQFLMIVKKYQKLRPINTKSDRFFLNFQKGKCTKQVIGRHKIAKMPKEIATYLNLTNPECYTGHCFRRSSAAVLAYLNLKRQVGWKSDKVAEGYIEDSDENETETTNKINLNIKLRHVNNLESHPLTSCQLSSPQPSTSKHQSSIQSSTSDRVSDSQPEIQQMNIHLPETMAERTPSSAEDTLVRYDNPVLVTKQPDKAPLSPRPGASTQPCVPTESKRETEEILNAILPPKEWEEEGQIWTQKISSTPATRLDVINLQEMLDTRLQQRQARETGICPVRRQLYTQCFDELIRQVTINCGERGLLLLRVRDEARITMEAYQTLYCSSIAFGMRKALQSEQGKSDLLDQVAKLEAERSSLEKLCSELKQKTEQLERRAAELRAAEEKRHQEELLALKKTNAQLKAQLEGIIAPKK